MDLEHGPELFLGKQECTIDDKRRFSVPPKFRNFLEKTELPSGSIYHLVLVPWYGGSVAAFSVTRWKEIEHLFLAMDYTTADFLAAKRRCMSLMEYVHTDPEGRAVLTPDMHAWLRLKEKTKGKLIMTGSAQHAEIWNADEWPDVQATGSIAAKRSEHEETYDEQLDLLMRAAKEARLLRDATLVPQPTEPTKPEKPEKPENPEE